MTVADKGQQRQAGFPLRALRLCGEKTYLLLALVALSRLAAAELTLDGFLTNLPADTFG